MTIGKKLTLAAGAAVALVLVLGASSLLVQERLGRQFDEVTTASVRKLEIAHTLGGAFAQMQAAARGAQLSIINNDSGTLSTNNDKFNQAVAAIRDNVKTLREMAAAQAEQDALRRVEDGLDAWLPLHQQYLDFAYKKQTLDAHRLMADRIYPVFQRMQEAMDQLAEYERQSLATARATAQSNIATGRWFTIVLILVALGVGLVTMLVVRRVNAELRQATSEMAEGAEQVASASSQVSAASQSLAQSSSEQAASLEETSASSEDITSMTRKNAENAQVTAKLTVEVDQRVGQANESLKEMIVSMKDINTASDKISRIIKVIDEIAFQTNILALNAAVEAARAGEAGLGFAVVADEVRSLAQRSAQAAKDTAAMIEESIAKSGEGSRKLDQVATAISAITESVSKVKTLADEVNLGSQEQARGMEQISHAISQMEQVTQRTAASAEESASASEELNAQADAMRSVIQRLRAMIDGESAASAASAALRSLQKHRGKTQNTAAKAGGAPEELSRGLAALKGAVAAHQKGGHETLQRTPATAASHQARESFPLDDDFKEF